MTTRPPNIPTLSSKVPAEVRRAFDAIGNYFKQRSFISQQDMVDSGLLNADGDFTLPDGYLNPAIPPKITGFAATGAFNTIILGWDEIAAGNIAYVEVWRNTEDVLGTALRVGTTNANVYADTPPDSSLSVTYYYWVRAVNFAGVCGPWNATAGTPANTADDPAYVMENLVADKWKPLADYSQEATVFPSVPNGKALLCLTGGVSGGDEPAWPAAVGAQITDGTVVWQLVSNNVSLDALLGIAQVGGVWSIVLKSILLGDATITSAKIQSLAADKIAATKLSAIVATLGDITSGTITMSNAASWIKSSNYSAGNSGFLIRGDGYAEFSNILARGNIEATSLKADTANIVETLHIAGNAVTVPWSGHGTMSSSGNHTWKTTLQSPALDMQGQPVLTINSSTAYLSFSPYLNNSSATLGIRLIDLNTNYVISTKSQTLTPSYDPVNGYYYPTSSISLGIGLQELYDPSGTSSVILAVQYYVDCIGLHNVTASSSSTTSILGFKR